LAHQIEELSDTVLHVFR